MSYADLARGSAGSRQPSAATALLPTLNGNRNVEGMLLKLANHVASYKRLADALGTAKDTLEHRNRLVEGGRLVQDLAQQIKDTLQAVHTSSSAGAGAEQQQKHRKLLQDFATILQDFKATQKLAHDRESAYLPRPSPTLGQNTFSSSQAAGLLQEDQLRGGRGQVEVVIEQQALLQAKAAKEAAALNMAVAHNEALIEERDQGIRDIARQIGEVNEMFQDLAVLINDQGLQVTTIDEQVTAAAERSKQGVEELGVAERSQRSYQNKCLWIWLVAALIVSLVIVIVFA